MANATKFASFTRPNDTTPYTVNDGVANSASSATMIEIQNAAAGANGTTFLTSLQITTSDKNCQAMFRIHFHSANTVSPAGVIEDNAPYALLTADKVLHQRWIDMPAFSTGDVTNSTYAETFLSGLSEELLTDGSGSLWLQIQLINVAYTPSALQTFNITASFVQ